MIVIDRREKAMATRLHTLCSNLNIESVIGTLPFGDYHFVLPSGRVIGVERKTVGDLLSSLPNHRLQKQLHGLKDITDDSYLLLEGHLDIRDEDGKLVVAVASRGAPTGWSAASVFSFIAGLHLSGVGFIQTPGASSSLLWLATFHRFLISRPDAYPDLDGTKHVKGTKGSKPRHDIAVLSQVPGVGPKTAERLLTRFSTVAGILSASDDTIGLGAHVGPKVVRSIRDTLGYVREVQ